MNQYFATLINSKIELLQSQAPTKREFLLSRHWSLEIGRLIKEYWHWILRVWTCCDGVVIELWQCYESNVLWQYHQDIYFMWMLYFFLFFLCDGNYRYSIYCLYQCKVGILIYRLVWYHSKMHYGTLATSSSMFTASLIILW